MATQSTEVNGDFVAAKDLYLDLLKKCLSFMLWEAKDGSNHPDELPPYRLRLKRFIMGTSEVKVSRQQAREEGRDWPKLAHTMIGLKRLNNLQSCVEEVLERGIPGDLIETGVWRGGASIFMRALLKVYGVTDRRIWAADSFGGLPPPNVKKYPADAGDPLHTYRALVVSLEEVQSNFERYGLLDDQVRFLKGWFRDTLPQAPMEKLAVVRLDGDMYESTMDGLVHLYPKLSVGGYVIIDDYGAILACRQAVDDFRTAHGIKEEIRKIDWGGVFWQRK